MKIAAPAKNGRVNRCAASYGCRKRGEGHVSQQHTEEGSTYRHVLSELWLFFFLQGHPHPPFLLFQLEPAARTPYQADGAVGGGDTV